REMLAQQEKAIQLQIDQISEALNDPALSEEARQKLAENLDFLKDKITQVKSAIKGGEEADQKKVVEEGKEAMSKVDVLGFSAQDWSDTFKNLETTEEKLKALAMIFTAVGNAGAMFADLQRRLGERDLRSFTAFQDKKKASLLNNLQQGYITQEDYIKETQRLEADAANKKAEMEYKQAKADKIARMFAAAGNTAMAITSALAAPFPVNTYLPFIVGALGAVQMGMIAAQPLP